LKRTVSGIVLILLLIGMLALALDIQPAKSEPKVIIIPDHYPTIQEAINNADDGDLIYVRSGVYYENVVVNKTVSLLGENRNSTIIDGGGNGTVVIIENAINTTLNGFTIRDSGTKMDNRTMLSSCGVFVWADNARILNNGSKHSAAQMPIGVWMLN
jgi:nitrous oxidase accessory protein NosD